MSRPVVELSEVVTATAAEVWSALVDPDRMGVWLGPFRFVSDGQVGGRFAICGMLTDDHPYKESGVLLERVPGERLRFSHWSPLWSLPDVPEHHAILEFRLTVVAQGTRVDMHQDLPDVEAIAEHASFFWYGALWRLREHFAGSVGPSSSS